MKKLLCSKIPNSRTWVQLDEMEAHHALRVMRLRDGQFVQVIDGEGHSAQVILRVRGEEAFVEKMSEDSSNAPSTSLTMSTSVPLPLTLEMAVLKGDAMEWVVEKAVELNLQKFVPVLTDYTVVQVKNKGPAFFRERWQKIADQALKQCGRLNRLEVLEPVSVEDLLTSMPAQKESPRLWCDEDQKNTAPGLSKWLLDHQGQFKPSRVLLGPEGGWSPHEQELLSRSSGEGHLHAVSLGPLILRAETAAIYSMSLISGLFKSS